MTKYDELPTLIKALKDANKADSDQKFIKFRDELVEVKQKLQDRETEIESLKAKINSSKTTSVIMTTAAAIGGYVVGK